jgi:DNA repair protein RadC
MTNPFQVHETQGYFQVLRPVTQDEILTMAKQLIKRRFRRGNALTSPNDARDFLILELALLEHEVFYCIFLDNQHRILEAECCFRGTLDSSCVYPREIVKRTLQLNAAALILAHNHPSGITEPSEADRAITRRLIDALKLVDVRVLDHFIIGGTELFSFAEHGLL